MAESNDYQPRNIEIRIGRQAWACAVFVDGRPLAVNRFSINMDMTGRPTDDTVHIELGLDGFFMEPIAVRGRLLVDEGDPAALPNLDELAATGNEKDHIRVYALEM